MTDYHHVGYQRRSGPQSPKNARLSWALVREIRRWAARDGFGMTLADQVRQLQGSYPLHEQTLRDLLRHLTWYDPNYTPGAADEDYFKGRPLIQIVLRTVKQWGADR